MAFDGKIWLTEALSGKLELYNMKKTVNLSVKSILKTRSIATGTIKMPIFAINK